MNEWRRRRKKRRWNLSQLMKWSEGGKLILWFDYWAIMKGRKIKDFGKTKVGKNIPFFHLFTVSLLSTRWRKKSYICWTLNQTNYFLDPFCNSDDFFVHLPPSQNDSFFLSFSFFVECQNFCFLILKGKVIKTETVLKSLFSCLMRKEGDGKEKRKVAGAVSTTFFTLFLLKKVSVAVTFCEKIFARKTEMLFFDAKKKNLGSGQNIFWDVATKFYVMIFFSKLADASFRSTQPTSHS